MLTGFVLGMLYAYFLVFIALEKHQDVYASFSKWLKSHREA